MKQLLFLAFSLLFFLPIPLQAQRTCATMNYLLDQETKFPGHLQRLAEIEAFTQKRIHAIGDGSEKVEGVITIPVVVHIVYNNSTENISDAQILTQVVVLNDDFRRLNSDADNTWLQATDAEIEFCLATVDPNGNATNGITRTQTSVSQFSTNNNVKFTSQGGKDAWPASDYMNIWVCDLNGFLGYAQFPGGNPNTDGVVCDYAYFGTIGTATTPFHLGRTATHEVGHWLNLRHIWGDGGCSVDDFVSDTPTSDAANYGCATTHVSCGSTDMVQNYMDYSDDACMNLFTAGQKVRMRALFDPGGSKMSLLNSTACGTPQPPTCNDGIQNQGEEGIDCGGPCPNSCPITYCTFEGTDTNYEYIDNVTIASIDNLSGNDNGYGDYTSLSTTVIAGSSIFVSLIPGFTNQSYDEFWVVYIDLNQDGDFDDTGEEVYTGNGNSTVTGSITIPLSATIGSTKMRVAMQWNATPPGPCGSFQYGEVEDYTINILPACTLTATVTLTDVSCFGASDGTVNLTVSGGTLPYSYSWNNGLGNVEDLSGLPPGTYSVTVTDSNLCEATATAVIDAPEVFVASTFLDLGVQCNGDSNGQATVLVVGGIIPYTFTWDSGENTAIATMLSGGTHSVTVSDSNGCTEIETISVPEPSAIALTGAVTDETIQGAANGAINVLISGGTPAYTYFWDNGQTEVDITGLNAGTYILTVTDNNECMETGAWTVNSGVSFCLTAILQGSFNSAATGPSDLMRTSLNQLGLIPLQQPYSGSPWNYGGSEFFSNPGTVPTDMVDWILVVIRDGADAGVVLGQYAGVLHADGSITDTAGNEISMDIFSASGYFVELFHRDHIPVMSANPIFPDASGDICYDFSSNMSMTYTNPVIFNDPIATLLSAAGTNYGLWAGNAQDLDCQVDANDVNALFIEYGLYGFYGNGDVNMDGLVDINDLYTLFISYNVNCHRAY